MRTRLWKTSMRHIASFQSTWPCVPCMLNFCSAWLSTDQKVQRQTISMACTLTKRTPSIMRLTLSLVMALWLGMVIAISFRLCTYAIWSTCTTMKPFMDLLFGPTELSVLHSMMTGPKCCYCGKLSHQRDEYVDAWRQSFAVLSKALHDEGGLLWNNPATIYILEDTLSRVSALLRG